MSLITIIEIFKQINVYRYLKEYDFFIDMVFEDKIYLVNNEDKTIIHILLKRIPNSLRIGIFAKVLFMENLENLWVLTDDYTNIQKLEENFKKFLDDYKFNIKRIINYEKEQK